MPNPLSNHYENIRHRLCISLFYPKLFYSSLSFHSKIPITFATKFQNQKYSLLKVTRALTLAFTWLH